MKTKLKKIALIENDGQIKLRYCLSSYFYVVGETLFTKNKQNTSNVCLNFLFNFDGLVDITHEVFSVLSNLNLFTVS